MLPALVSNKWLDRLCLGSQRNVEVLKVFKMRQNVVETLGHEAENDVFLSRWISQRSQLPERAARFINSHATLLWPLDIHYRVPSPQGRLAPAGFFSRCLSMNPTKWFLSIPDLVHPTYAIMCYASWYSQDLSDTVPFADCSPWPPCVLKYKVWSWNTWNARVFLSRKNVIYSSKLSVRAWVTEDLRMCITAVQRNKPPPPPFFFNWTENGEEIYRYLLY